VNASFPLLVACAVIGQQKPLADVEPFGTKVANVVQVLTPKLTLLEEEDAKVTGTDTWIFDELAFISPRMITVEVPGKQPTRRTMLYVVYRVTNRGKKDRKFVPSFLLVDDRGNSYLDTIMPKVQRAIQAREDPMRPLENSVSAIRDIKTSTELGVDRALYGVAIWDATPEPAPKDGSPRKTIDPTHNGFDILITGLSNAYKPIPDPVTGETKTQRKTLQLKFTRPGDEFNQHEREIKYTGHEWIYQ